MEALSETELVFGLTGADLPPPGEAVLPGRTEAETLTRRDGFRVSHNPHASAGAYLEATLDQSRASGVFAGPMGLYDLTLGYMDESDGFSQMFILVNGAEVAKINWNKWPSTDTVTDLARTEYLLPGLALRPGDVIALEGWRNHGEPLRTDYLDLADRLTTLTGTAQADRLEGGAADERLLGLGGADRITARGGRDLIFAGAGDDTVRAGEGDDTVYGGAGLDVIYTGTGADVVVLTDPGSFDKLYDFEVGVDALRVEIDGVSAADLFLDRWRLMARIDGQAVKLAYIPDADAAGASIAELLQPEVPDDASTLHELVFGSEVKGEISFLEDSDWFRFEAEAGRFYVFTAIGDPDSETPLGVPRLSLWSGEADFLDSSNDSGAPVAQLPYLATESGQLFVAAYDLYGGDAGDYVLSVVLAEDLDAIPGDASTTAVLPVGGEVTSDLGYPGDADWFRADLPAGRLYRFDIFSAPGVNPELSLLDAEGQLIQTFDGRYAGRPYFETGADMQVFVRVDSSSGHEAGLGVGDYRVTLTVEHEPEAIPGTALTTVALAPGETLASGISYPGDDDWVRVMLEAGHSYAFELGADLGSDTPLAFGELTLLDASGAVLGSTRYGGDGFAAQLDYTPGADELVFLSARGGGDYHTGDYILGVT